jgi:hypothetical protein
MNGHIARTGFRYQDLYLLFRVLDIVRGAYQNAWNSGAGDLLNVAASVTTTFGIEANNRLVGFTKSDDVEPPRDWDVFVADSEVQELIEVKSGAISKADREVFWQRLRHERRPDLLVPALVVDPAKAGNVAIWRKLTEVALTYTGDLSGTKPPRVDSAELLLQEALWCLCSADATADVIDEPYSLESAKDLLSRFRLYCWPADELDSAVAQFLVALFSDGITEAIRRQVMGWIDERATHPDRQLHFFSAHEMIAEIGLLQHSLSAQPGQIARWRNLWQELPLIIRRRTRTNLGDTGASILKEQSQPTIVVAVDASGGNRVILGSAGLGKSALLAQVAAEKESAGSNPLWCGAPDIGAEEIEDFDQSVRFRATLASLQVASEPVWLLVDGLDEVYGSRREAFAQRLARLGQIPHLRVMVTIRDAIWREDGRVRSKLEQWEQLSLSEWDEEIVRGVLQGTTADRGVSGNLLQLLRRPILLDVFWRTFVEVEPTDLEKIKRIQTRHGILAAFWQERLIESSRHSGIPALSDRLNEIWDAAATTIGPFAQSGLDEKIVGVLLSESVLVKEGRLQPRLQLRHPLFRDFALAQWCLSRRDPLTIVELWKTIQGGLQQRGSLRAISRHLKDRMIGLSRRVLEARLDIFSF